jgi:catechol 2,3-dioxygenase-like lactoylglutathione lyase family enzyme
MSKATKLLHTRYRINDLEKTVKFYKDVLGLEETRRHKSPRGSELVFMKAPDSDELIELCYFPASGCARRLRNRADSDGNNRTGILRSSKFETNSNWLLNH